MKKVKKNSAATNASPNPGQNNQGGASKANSASKPRLLSEKINKKDELNLSTKRTDRSQHSPVHDVFSVTASVPEISKPIQRQKPGLKSLLLKASKENFEKQVPYFVVYNKQDRLQVTFDVNGFWEAKYRKLEKEEASQNKILQNTFFSAQIFAFLDDSSSAIPVGNLQSLEAMGLETEYMQAQFLGPTTEPLRAQVMYLLLFEEGLLARSFLPYIEKLKTTLSKEQIEEQREELLVDFADSSNPKLLKKLLEQKVDPNAFSPLLGINALHVARGANMKENIALLLRYGADPDAEPQEPAC